MSLSTGIWFGLASILSWKTVQATIQTTQFSLHATATEETHDSLVQSLRSGTIDAPDEPEEPAPLWRETNSPLDIQDIIGKLDWDVLSSNPCAMNNINISEGKVELLALCPHLINWHLLSLNPSAHQLLRTNLHRVNWMYISANSNMIGILERNIDKVCWEYMSKNVRAIHLIVAHWDTARTKVNKYWLSQNPEAVALLEKYPDMIDWRGMCENPNPDAMRLVEANLDLADWSALSRNPNAIPLLERMLERTHDCVGKIVWLQVCLNPKGIPLLLAHFDVEQLPVIFWKYLSLNPSATPLFEDASRWRYIHWEWFSLNPSAPAFLDATGLIAPIHWSNLSTNPKAVDLLVSSIDKVDWKALSENPQVCNVINRLIGRSTRQTPHC